MSTTRPGVLEGVTRELRSRLSEDEVRERCMVPEDATIFDVENCMEVTDNNTGFLFRARVREKCCRYGWGYTFLCAKEGVEDTQASVE
jgi:hypothetical protein